MIDDIEQRIAASSARHMLDLLASFDEKERRALAKPVGTLFRSWYRAYFSGKAGPALLDPDALKIAMLATASRSELRPYLFLVVPHSVPFVEVMAALAPSWIDYWVEDLIEDRPFLASNLAPLWRAGLCSRPTSDALILGYYSHFGGRDLAADPEFLAGDVWRFFEIEGGGELSLAAHDKYCAPAKSWSACLLTLAQEGKLDRDRLLDASLDALGRDFGQFRAGWYSRFHSALAPSPEEQAVRCDRYLHLLASAVPPTVSLALKALKALDKAGKVPVEDLLVDIRPALLSRQKAAATTALQLLASAARRAPERTAEIAVLALTALVSEAADVQEKVLDLVEKLGQADLPAVQAGLAEYRDIVAPSARQRLSGILAAPDQHAPAGEQAGEPDQGEIIRSAIAPCASFDETLAAYLAVLEGPRDPFAVERAVDGLSRFGAKCPPGSSRLSPLAKRAQQIFDNAGYHKIRLALAACGLAWSRGGTPSEILREAALNHRFSRIPDESLAATFLQRCDEIIVRIGYGQGLPLLSLPSDRSGQVAACDLVDRLDHYRASGAAPGMVDLALALTRLGRDGRERLQDRVDPGDEVGRAVAFALGADTITAGDGPIWMSAQLARSGDSGQVQAPSRYRLILEKGGNPPYEWCHAAVESGPELQQPDPQAPSSLLHYRNRHGWLSASACGCVAADIAWSSLVCPGDPEAFLANAIGTLDTSQKLADHPSIAYLDAFDRPSGEPGAMGYAVLAYYLASEDRAVCAHTLDKLALLIEERRISAARYAAAILPFLLIGPFPSMRWTRNLSVLAQAGAGHRAFVGDVITGLMRFDPVQAPRDVGGMIELLYQLQVDSGKPIDDPDAIACLKRLGGGGKVATFSKKLLSLQAG